MMGELKKLGQDEIEAIEKLASMSYPVTVEMIDFAIEIGRQMAEIDTLRTANDTLLRENTKLQKELDWFTKPADEL